MSCLRYTAFLGTMMVKTGGIGPILNYRTLYGGGCLLLQIFQQIPMTHEYFGSASVSQGRPIGSWDEFSLSLIATYHFSDPQNSTVCELKVMEKNRSPGRVLYQILRENFGMNTIKMVRQNQHTNLMQPYKKSYTIPLNLRRARGLVPFKTPKPLTSTYME